MTDRELALELIKVDRSPDFYYKILEEIRKKESKTLKGKLEELLEDYDSQVNYCEFDRIKFIDNVRKILEEEK